MKLNPKQSRRNRKEKWRGTLVESFGQSNASGCFRFGFLKWRVIEAALTRLAFRIFSPIRSKIRRLILNSVWFTHLQILEDFFWLWTINIIQLQLQAQRVRPQKTLSRSLSFSQILIYKTRKNTTLIMDNFFPLFFLFMSVSSRLNSKVTFGFRLICLFICLFLSQFNQ